MRMEGRYVDNLLETPILAVERLATRRGSLDLDLWSIIEDLIWQRYVRADEDVCESGGPFRKLVRDTWYRRHHAMSTVTSDRERQALMVVWAKEIKRGAFFDRT